MGFQFSPVAAHEGVADVRHVSRKVPDRAVEDGGEMSDVCLVDEVLKLEILKGVKLGSRP